MEPGQLQSISREVVGSPGSNPELPTSHRMDTVPAHNGWIETDLDGNDSESAILSRHLDSTLDAHRSQMPFNGKAVSVTTGQRIGVAPRERGNNMKNTGDNWWKETNLDDKSNDFQEEKRTHTAKHTAPYSSMGRDRQQEMSHPLKQKSQVMEAKILDLLQKHAQGLKISDYRSTGPNAGSFSISFFLSVCFFIFLVVNGRDTGINGLYTTCIYRYTTIFTRCIL